MNALTDPTSLFHDLGDLHDAKVERTDPSGEVLSLHFDDLHANFRDPPFGLAKTSAVLQFVSVDEVHVDVVEMPAWITELVVARTDTGRMALRVELSPSGVIECTFAVVLSDLSENELRRGIDA